MAIHYRSVLDQIKKRALQCGRNPEAIQLVAVTKKRDVKLISETYIEGCRNFGESRVQEALGKIPLLPSDCHWHYIGTLQTNKVAKVIPQFTLIHSVDTIHLAQKISSVSLEKGVTQSILLQVNTSREASKQGMSAEGWEAVLDELNALPNIRIEGLMTMAPYTKDAGVIRKCFRELCDLREKWKSRMRDPEIFRELSMGMSNDFLIAIEEGASIIRVGSAIWEGSIPAG